MGRQNMSCVNLNVLVNAPMYLVSVEADIHS